MNGSSIRLLRSTISLVRRYGLRAGAAEARRILGEFDSGLEFYRAAATAYSQAGYEVNRYALDVSPVTVVAVDPESVTQITGREWKPWRPFDDQLGTVRAGSWDKAAPHGVPEIHRPYPKRFEEYPVFVAFRNHFDEGVPWEETAYYAQCLELARTGQSEYRFEGVDDVDPYFRQFDRIYEDIRRDGYRSQVDLFGDDRSFCRLLRNELLVDIGRDGEPLFVENRHRLAIAKLLGLSRIPAVVLCRHERWVKKIESGTADCAVEPYFSVDKK